MGHDIHFDSVEEAVAYCRGLTETGVVDLFRGQMRDWPVIAPSLFRGSGHSRAKARSVLDEFIEWATVVPQMAPYHHNLEQITAIAQHYGIPTPFLDLTTDPEIAGLFSRGETDADCSQNAVIYCFKRDTLQTAPALRIVEIDVANLWRLQAQKGLFLEYLDETGVDAVRTSAIRVHLPCKLIEAAERTRIYPLRKSALELVIDQWTYRHQVSEMFANLDGIKVQMLIRRYTYPGMFRWRAVPEFGGDWVEYDPGWVFPEPEHVDNVIHSRVVTIVLDGDLDVRAAYEDLEGQFRTPLEIYARQGGAIEFAVTIASHDSEAAGATIILNRCWDGIRVHPYSTESAIRCMAATALALIRRVIQPESSKEWEEDLWGDIENIDTAPVGGHLDAAVVSKAALREALHTKHYDSLTIYARRKVGNTPMFLMDYVVDPWILFDFRKLSKLFIEQFIPSCIGSYWDDSLSNNDGKLGELWGISFNVALLAFVTRFGFRFYSPIAVEKDVDHVILISGDMDEAEIEEVFISCLPGIFSGGDPYVVRFTDYAADEREVWQIERAVEQCKIILRVGGISVLDVIPGAREIDSDPPSPTDASGLGALHIWAIANDRLSEVSGVEFGKIRHIFDEFWQDLGRSNANLEARARAQPDWPQ